MTELGRGIYFLKVEALNEVTTVPISANITVKIASEITDLRMGIFGNIVGKETVFLVTIESLDLFSVEINYGDGQSDYLDPIDLIAMVRNKNGTKTTLTFLHIYHTGGDFNVTVNVINDVDSFMIWEVFSPIISMTLTSWSPWVIRSPGHAVVKATVKGGKDLDYIWSFSDNFEETNVTR